jgi:hypothetical protein
VRSWRETASGTNVKRWKENVRKVLRRALLSLHYKRLWKNFVAGRNEIATAIAGTPLRIPARRSRGGDQCRLVIDAKLPFTKRAYSIPFASIAKPSQKQLLSSCAVLYREPKVRYSATKT